MAEAKLTLYHFRGCPYCAKVQRALAALGLDIEQRDVRFDPEAQAALLEARGRGTVPVLRVEEEDSDRWMPESDDIVRYLFERYGDGRAPPWWVRVNPVTVGLVLAAIVAWLLSRWL